MEKDGPSDTLKPGDVVVLLPRSAIQQLSDLGDPPDPRRLGIALNIIRKSMKFDLFELTWSTAIHDVNGDPFPWDATPDIRPGDIAIYKGIQRTNSSIHPSRLGRKRRKTTGATKVRRLAHTFMFGKWVVTMDSDNFIKAVDVPNRVFDLFKEMCDGDER